MSDIYNRCYAEVDLSAIEHNLNELKSCLDSGVMALAVVKANAYGHGAVAVARHIEDKVDYFGVATLDEAVELREAGIRKPVLIFSYTSPTLYSVIIDKDITPTIYNTDEAKALSALAKKIGKRVKIHVCVDTGMGRIGFSPDECGADAVKEISGLDGVWVEGLFSHYACADSADKRDAQAQTALFDSFISMLDARGVNIPIKHICNSAATIEGEKQYSMCRLGIALYGIYPSDEVRRDRVKLIPAMKVVSHVIHIKRVPKGFKIGYGHIYEAEDERTVATVSIGYADGFRRCLYNEGYVLIRGKVARVVGKVCMDQIMVDVTDIQGVKVDDEAVILGESGDKRISAEALGSMSHSFSYEVVCDFSHRVKRIYKK